MKIKIRPTAITWAVTALITMTVTVSEAGTIEVMVKYYKKKVSLFPSCLCYSLEGSIVFRSFVIVYVVDF